MDQSKSSHQQQQQQHPYLGVNKLGKNIHKSPPHHHRPPNSHKKPSLSSSSSSSSASSAPPDQQQQQQQQQQPQPHVYNISKHDFRSIVQQLTGTPSRDTPPPPSQPHRPSLPRPPSVRLHKIRPPPLPLAPAARLPPPPPPPPHQPSADAAAAAAAAVAWAESPVSAYMRYLENSLLSADTPHRPLLSPRLPSPHRLPPTQPFPSPRSGAYRHNPLPPTPPPAVPPLSPTAFLNLLSPKSPCPLLSPGFQYPPPLTPTFALSPLPQAGILGLCPLPPLSPGFPLPPSPSGFPPFPSPTWGDLM